MEPNKFEKHIKEQLREREIQPSAEAWNRLSEQLDDIAPPPSGRSYFRYGIAASIGAILVLSLLFFNSKETVNAPEVEVVETQEPNVEATKHDTEFLNNEDSSQALVENESDRQPTKQYNRTIKASVATEVTNQIATSGAVADTAPDSEQKAQPDSAKEALINDKILELVAAVDSLEQHSDALTEAEVDALLRNAQEELLVDKLFDQTGTVDAMALLTEVEDELDQSFRDQIFESLKAGFLKVRTAVADRNK